jgi:hypothetical protein
LFFVMRHTEGIRQVEARPYGMTPEDTLNCVLLTKIEYFNSSRLP